MLVVGYGSCVLGYIIVSVNVDSLFFFELIAEICCYLLITSVIAVGLCRIGIEINIRSSCFFYITYI